MNLPHLIATTPWQLPAMAILILVAACTVWRGAWVETKHQDPREDE